MVDPTQQETSTSDVEPEVASPRTQSDKVALKMVKGERYRCRQAKLSDVILPGEIIFVTPELADSLLEDSYTDASNNVHNYFREATQDELAGTDAKPTTPAQRRASRPPRK